MPQNENCENCKFFQVNGNYDGVCRRYPPAGSTYNNETDKLESQYPPVEEDGWCGEYKKAE